MSIPHRRRKTWASNPMSPWLNYFCFPSGTLLIWYETLIIFQIIFSQQDYFVPGINKMIHLSIGITITDFTRIWCKNVPKAE